MKIFIDESGNFTPEFGWSATCSLGLPHASLRTARGELIEKTQSWPRVNGELKGGSLGPEQLMILVSILFKHHAVLHSAAINVAREDANRLAVHKSMQCEGITKHLTPEHHPTMEKQLWELRTQLERLPSQLYVQCVVMTELVCMSVEGLVLYFAQRKPKDLGRFAWVVDAKDPRKITTQEAWWRDTLGPMIESRSMRQPFSVVNAPGFKFTYFDHMSSQRACGILKNRERASQEPTLRS